MTAFNPDERGRGSRSNLVAGAIVLILLLVGAGVGIWALTGGFGRDKRSTYSVYFRGLPQIGAETEILFQGAHVGEVVRTDPPRIGLQLLVTAALAPELTQVLTLFPGQSVHLALAADSGLMTVALASLTAGSISHSGGTYSLRRTGASRWAVDQSRSREPLVVNGQKRRSDTLVVQTGDILAVGRVLIEWQDISEYSRVRAHIDIDKLRKAAGMPDSTTAGFLLGPRSSLGIAGAFGLGRPALRLEPGFGRQAFVLGTDSVIAPVPTLDLEQTVQGMLTYLNSPAALRRAPASRFERVVSDLNDGLEQVARVGARLETILQLADDVSRQHGGRGMVGRLVLPPATLESLDATAARIAGGVVPFSDTTRSVFARLKLDTMEAAATRAIERADRALARADTAVLQVAISADSVAQTVKDSLPPLVHRMNLFLDQGKGTAKEVQRWILPAAISAGVVGVVGILAMLGVF